MIATISIRLIKNIVRPSECIFECIPLFLMAKNSTKLLTDITIAAKTIRLVVSFIIFLSDPLSSQSKKKSILKLICST